MSNYKAIGAQGTFKPPQPWIFKPVEAFRIKIYFMIILHLAFIYLIIILVNLLENKQNLVKTLILATLVIIVYFSVALVIFELYIKSIEYQVHGTEIVIKKGLINITENHIPFSNITNIAIRQGPFDRLFGIGTIIVYTGGANLNSSREMGQIRGTRIFADVGYFVLNQIKTYETFFNYLLDATPHSQTKLSKDFWMKFLDLSIDIRKELENQ